MKKKIIKNEDQSSIGVLQEGKHSKFWQLIVEALEESKEHIESQMSSEDMQELPAEQYKFMTEVFKAKKKFIETLIETPDNISSWLSKPDMERKEFDPYEKARRIEP